MPSLQIAMSATRVPIGAIHGRLTVLGEAPRRRDLDGHSRRYLLVRCECGAEREMREAVLLRDTTVSCGCWRLEAQTSHGLSGTPAFKAWHAMHWRCAGKNAKTFHDYAGRGIDVCERWSGVNGINNFVADMGQPRRGMTLDRIDNDGNYGPGNCRWATPAEQMRNMRANVFVTYDGKRLCLLDACAAAGVKMGTVSGVISKTGMPAQLAFDYYAAWAAAKLKD